MEEVLRTNDTVLLSFVEALLADSGIAAVLADANMSVLEGSLGILPRRVLVASEHAAEARKLIADAESSQAAGPPHDE